MTLPASPPLDVSWRFFVKYYFCTRRRRSFLGDDALYKFTFLLTRLLTYVSHTNRIQSLFPVVISGCHSSIRTYGAYFIFETYMRILTYVILAYVWYVKRTLSFFVVILLLLHCRLLSLHCEIVSNYHKS